MQISDLLKHHNLIKIVRYNMNDNFGTLNQSVVQYISTFLQHTGPLKCTSQFIRESLQLDETCCPHQMTYHPLHAELKSRDLVLDSGSDAEDSDDNYGRNGCEISLKMAEKDCRRSFWSCCGKSFKSNGCKSVLELDEEALELVRNPTHDDDDDYDPNIYNAELSVLQANQQERDEFLDSCYNRHVGGSDPENDWDDSIGGDASRHCSCGYADGVYSDCICRGTGRSEERELYAKCYPTHDTDYNDIDHEHDNENDNFYDDDDDDDDDVVDYSL